MAEIKLERQQEPARLRVYIGAAPGVGKTYHMLNDAYLMKHQQGVDVVIGLVETHGRKETEARIRDLEVVPQRVIPYRGVNLKEMDVDAILARHPQTVIVDELAHTNVPGSKNRKRYEDVLELLDAGINVMTAVNIQHLETLNDAVNRSANTVIRETVPDNFLKRANEVVNVDVTVDELRSRLRQGKIYAAEKVEQSLANFFRKGNLNMLRELALRTTAEQVGNQASAVPPRPGPGTGADPGEGDGLPQHPSRHRAPLARGARASPAAWPATGTPSTSPAPTTTRATATPRPSIAWKSISAWPAIWARR
jgi:two-component system sensor histidine kinase KdpD